MAKKSFVNYERLGIKCIEETARYLDTFKNDLSLIRKAQKTVIEEVRAEERIEVSTITQEVIDRDGEFIVSSGIVLDHYKLNPVVLVNHKYEDLSWMNCVWIKDIPNGLKAATRYPSASKDYTGPWMTDTLWELVAVAKVMVGKSIGYLELETHRPTQADVDANPALEFCSKIVDKCLLLEYSVCPCPINQEAVHQYIGNKAMTDLERYGFTKEAKKLKKAKVSREEIVNEALKVLKCKTKYSDIAKKAIEMLNTQENDY